MCNSSKKALAKKPWPAQKTVLRFRHLLFCSNRFSWEEKVAIIADVASIGMALFTVLFFLWMLKQTFTGK